MPPRSRVSNDTWGSVCSGDDPITLESWSDVKLTEDIVSIRPEIGGVESQGFCIRRLDLIASMKANPVYKWIPEDADEPDGDGVPDLSEVYYKHPAGYWLDSSSLALLEQEKPRKYSLFQIQYVGEKSVGTEYSSSSLHGAKVDIFRLVPLASQKEYMEQVKRGRVASYRRTSFARLAKERQDAKQALNNTSRQRRTLLQQEQQQLAAAMAQAQEAESLPESLSVESESDTNASYASDDNNNSGIVNHRPFHPSARKLISWTGIYKRRQIKPNETLILKKGRTERHVVFLSIESFADQSINLLDDSQTKTYRYDRRFNSWKSLDMVHWKLYKPAENALAHSPVRQARSSSIARQRLRMALDQARNVLNERSKSKSKSKSRSKSISRSISKSRSRSRERSRSRSVSKSRSMERKQEHEIQSVIGVGTRRPVTIERLRKHFNQVPKTLLLKSGRMETTIQIISFDRPNTLVTDRGTFKYKPSTKRWTGSNGLGIRTWGLWSRG